MPVLEGGRGGGGAFSLFHISRLVGERDVKAAGEVEIVGIDASYASIV
jgi:hypothetical protein